VALKRFMRRIVLTLLALAVPVVIAVVAAHQTADLPALGGDAWAPIGFGVGLIAVVIGLLLWVQLRKR
jgi:membrane protease YdiL (CAAX protease family)